MATGEKVLKLSGEALHKLKSDHEQFLEAYEKPTQIYRFLRARHSLKPLFLHRNLSYMRMHRNAAKPKHKRKRRLRVNDLLQHTRPEKPDLAAQIKSDNFLELSVSALEDGIDFDSFLADDAQDLDSSNVASQCQPSKSYDRQLIEIEILLYSFSQPSAEALLSGDKNSFQCHCLSLGKRVIDCNGGTGVNESKHLCPPSLSIPESTLTWKHRRSLGGTQMIVFRASQFVTESSSPLGNSKQRTSQKNLSQDMKESVHRSDLKNGSTARHKQHQKTDTPPAPPINPHKQAPHPKPKTCDASVMTDIQFGTDCISELTPIYQSQIDAISSTNPPSEISSNGRPSPLLPLSDHMPSSSSPSRQDKCTSPLIPKLALRNGVINGLVNGSGSHSVRKNARQRRRKRKPPVQRSKTNFNKSSTSHNLVTPPPIESTPPSKDCSIRIQTRPEPKRKKLGSGKHGSRSFLISIPRLHYNKLANATHISPPSKTSHRGHKNSRRFSPGKRRRTEVQLLLDGDKPRGERLRVDEVPKFTAEDVSSWTSSWRGTSARKITPVEHFSYPPFSGPPSVGSSCSSFTGSGRKRSHSEDSSGHSTVSSPKLPSQKNLRLASSMDSTTSNLSREQAPLPQAARDCSTSDPLESEKENVVSSKCLRVESNDVFCGELVAFDSRGSCLLENGEYTILMRKCCEEGNEKEPSDLLIFEPLTWNSVFSFPQQSDISSKKNKSLALKFTLSWSKGVPGNILCSNLDTALDLKKIRESYYPSPPLNTQDLTVVENGYPETNAPCLDGTQSLSSLEQPPSLEGEKILFNFLYGSNSLQQTESKMCTNCPWCFISCGSFYSLLKHMSLCHPRFQFTYSPSLQKAKVIEVHVNKLYDTSSSMERDPGEKDGRSLMKRKQRPSKCFSCTCVLVDRGVDVEEDLSEFMNDGSWRRGYNANRLYYHLNSSLPMLEEEIKMDSEGEERALEWQKVCCQKMLDEFTDVNKGEKVFMKLWNLFVMENKLIAEKQISEACLVFVTKYRGKLLEEKIDRNFLSHLISLCDFDLIPSSSILQCMSALNTPTL